jgi:hypothetical protein
VKNAQAAINKQINQTPPPTKTNKSTNKKGVCPDNYILLQFKLFLIIFKHCGIYNFLKLMQVAEAQ